MELIGDMKKIEEIQNEIGLFLISAMPVPWKKICFYSKCGQGYASAWYAFAEKETDVICTKEFFSTRYNSYPVKDSDISSTLTRLSGKLYDAYVDKFGEDKAWRAMFYTIEENGSFHIDFEHELPKGNLIEQHDAVFERFFGVPFEHVFEYMDEKYPY